MVCAFVWENAFLSLFGLIIFTFKLKVLNIRLLIIVNQVNKNSTKINMLAK
jgi:hypothetical protein